ncbi:DUF2982 domain-containing protein [uncultured Photobacterium sp.]|uniref:DUF2982 domain-containing protein n=1 Tax=uncultured Photobacterium sp. TaxID=173973 RepID=UPI002601EC57|nr:DUF2982 domain-containing protein [uncultured Photobacterium sp.]
METRYIKPPIAKSGIYQLIFSVITLIVLGLTVYLHPEVNAAAIAILFILALAMFLIAYKQSQEPALSFTLTFMHIQFHSPYGGWLARWKNIAEIGTAAICYQGWCEPIPWVGIRLKDYDEFLDSICPRIASKILLEQRILLIMAYKRNDDPPHEIEDMLFDDTHYVTRNGKVLKGLLAMLANRMKYNREFLGYDFFISEDLLDRPSNDFVGLARRYLAAS